MIIENYVFEDTDIKGAKVKNIGYSITDGYTRCVELHNIKGEYYDLPESDIKALAIAIGLIKQEGEEK